MDGVDDFIYRSVEFTFEWQDEQRRFVCDTGEGWSMYLDPHGFYWKATFATDGVEIQTIAHKSVTDALDVLFEQTKQFISKFDRVRQKAFG